MGHVMHRYGYDDGDEVTYTWRLRSNGYLTSVKQVGAAETKYNANFLSTYTDGNLCCLYSKFNKQVTTNKSIRYMSKHRRALLFAEHL